MVLQCLAHPHNKRILGGKCKVVGDINMMVEVVHDGGGSPLINSTLLISVCSSLLCFDVDGQRFGPVIEFRARDIPRLPARGKHRKICGAQQLEAFIQIPQRRCVSRGALKKESRSLRI